MAWATCFGGSWAKLVVSQEEPVAGDRGCHFATEIATLLQQVKTT
jgi:hypothetical protein